MLERAFDMAVPQKPRWVLLEVLGWLVRFIWR